MRLFLAGFVLVLGMLFASPRAIACPTGSPVDCGGYCCPTTYPFCCAGMCGVSSACGMSDAAPPPVSCTSSQVALVASCGGDTCACADACTDGTQCPSGCCSRGRCTAACVCQGAGGWSTCGSAAAGGTPLHASCDAGARPTDAQGNDAAWAPVAIAPALSLAIASRRVARRQAA